MNNHAWVGLESLALALIFAPEPFTTFIGVGLLAYARRKKVEQQRTSRRTSYSHQSLGDYYHCKVKMVGKSSVAYHLSPIRQGQLPLPKSTIARLYESRDAWEAYHKTMSSLRPKTTFLRSSKTEPAGLLKTPAIRYQTRLHRSQRMQI